MNGPKTPGDLFAEHFLGVLRKGAAEGMAKVVRHVGNAVAIKLDVAANAFEAASSCTCVGGPRTVVVRGPEDEEDELITVHASGCPSEKMK